MKAKEKNWHEKLKKLRTEEQDAKEAMNRAVSYIDQGGQKINKGLKINDMIGSGSWTKANRIWKWKTGRSK